MSALRDQHTGNLDGVAEASRAGQWDDAAPTRSTETALHPTPPQLVDVMCECGHSTCDANIVMSLREYEAVRRHPSRFLIKEGHEVAEAVRIVGYGTGYVVVAKPEAFSVGP